MEKAAQRHGMNTAGPLSVCKAGKSRLSEGEYEICGKN